MIAELSMVCTYQVQGSTVIMLRALGAAAFWGWSVTMSSGFVPILCSCKG